MKAEFEARAQAFDPREYWKGHKWNIQVIQAKGKERTEKAGEQVKRLKPVKASKAEAEDDDMVGVAEQPTNSVSMEAAKPIRQADDDTTMLSNAETASATNTPPSSPSASPLAKHKDKAKASTTTQSKGPPQNYYEGDPSAKQLSESVADFLTRLPPSTTTILTAPWLWICNPYPSPRPSVTEDIPTFKQLGLTRLETFLELREDVEASNPSKTAGVITRMMESDRDNLKSDLISLAKQHGVTNGKWMLFPSESNVDIVWGVVCNAVWEGKLGNVAKVATGKDVDTEDVTLQAFHDGESGVARRTSDSRDSGARLICVYTPDFSNEADVRRVIKSLKDLGLLQTDGNAYGGENTATIYYKADAYTYLDILNGNEYKIKASMYCSKDLFPEWYPSGSAAASRGGRSGGRSRAGARGRGSGFTGVGRRLGS
jgi:hypothetical protein